MRSGINETVQIIADALHLAGLLVWTSSTEPKFTGVVDVEEIGGGNVYVYVKHRGWLCGTPWTAAINIPLIADEVPINERRAIARGRLVASSDVSGPD